MKTIHVCVQMPAHKFMQNGAFDNLSYAALYTPSESVIQKY